jgi:hypothetical protein
LTEDQITTKELHNLLIQRIYHEDTLLQMRSYNFITANVFLGAGFVFVSAGQTEGVSRFGYVIAGAGFLWALLQVVYGKMHVTATNLWRKQAWLAEETLQTKFDSTLFELYELGKTQTPFGTIEMTSKRKRPPYESISYRLPFLLGFNMSFAVTVPWKMAALWIALTYILLLNHHPAWRPVVVVIILLLLLSSLCRTAYPQSMLDKHIEVRYGKQARLGLFRRVKICVLSKFEGWIYLLRHIKRIRIAFFFNLFR